jgi:hypothetical protein
MFKLLRVCEDLWVNAENIACVRKTGQGWGKVTFGPCTELLDADEMESLFVAIEKALTPPQAPPPQPSTLEEASAAKKCWVVRLGDTGGTEVVALVTRGNTSTARAWDFATGKRRWKDKRPGHFSGFKQYLQNALHVVEDPEAAAPINV